MKLFPKTEKYSLGQKLESLTLLILENSIEAVYLPKQEKIPFLREIDRKARLLKILIRLAHEVRAIDNKKYIALEERLQEIGKMLGGWIKSLTGEKEHH